MIIDLLNNLDAQIYLFFNGMHTPLLDRFMMLFTGRFIWVPMYAALAILLFKTFGARLAGVYLIFIALAITLTDQTCATVLRPFFARLRPSNPENPLSAMALLVDGYRGGTYGFPSCHSANSFALATFISLLVRRPRIVAFIFLWAIANSYTRLYLGVHYPGDLLAGALVGTFFGAGCYMLARRITPSVRQRSLEDIGRPLFVIAPGIQIYGLPRQGIGITIGDVAITVCAATVIYITISSL